MQHLNKYCSLVIHSFLVSFSRGLLHLLLICYSLFKLFCKEIKIVLYRDSSLRLVFHFHVYLQKYSEAFHMNKDLIQLGYSSCSCHTMIEEENIPVFFIGGVLTFPVSASSKYVGAHAGSTCKNNSPKNELALYKSACMRGGQKNFIDNCGQRIVFFVVLKC
jgi:hypothetical protein